MKTLLAIATVLLLAACERPQERLDAAQDIHAFLTAAREGDRATFDRHIDREALKTQLRGQMDEVPGAQQIPPEMRDQLLDQAIDGFGPEMFKMATAQGPLAGGTPGVAEIAAVLKPLGATRVCLPPKPGDDACAVTFEDQGEVWRLVALDARRLQVESGMPSPSEFLERFPQR